MGERAMRGADAVTFMSPDGGWVDGVYTIDPHLTVLGLSAVSDGKVDFQIEVALTDIVTIKSCEELDHACGILRPEEIPRAVVIELVPVVGSFHGEKQFLLEATPTRRERFVACLTTILAKAKRARARD